MYNDRSGRVAQLGERSVRNGEAAGSIPATSTISFYDFCLVYGEIMIPYSSHRTSSGNLTKQSLLDMGLLQSRAVGKLSTNLIFLFRLLRWARVWV